MMKRICVLTVYKNINCGSKLQAFDLQYTLKTMDYIGKNIILDTNTTK